MRFTSILLLVPYLTLHPAAGYYDSYGPPQDSYYTSGGASRYDDYYYSPSRDGYGGGHGGGGYGGGHGGGGYGKSNALELLATGALTLAALAILTAILGAVLSALGLIVQGGFVLTPAADGRDQAEPLVDRNGTSPFSFLGFTGMRRIIDSIG